ncbi:ATP-dependent DNA helicase [Desulfobulbus alkaliphilus]|uniref:ATP-dependent DNA helicase n=1 Tax=Desulfobulbus alkaliphilus TaxID=869814 RepID=UPI0019631C3B|nr:ATP-dependent DNA helicase [Desulfobulbus alkaliphilus]MBM9537841.1 ATP-dependent DNA helicase [Desulfobulbus alkaliphilus]
MDSLFGPEGLLARQVPGYTCRPGQLEMARAVHNLLAVQDTDEPIEQATSLVIEAETGLGKTLAYLIPAVLSGRRVVVSTNTRNLQDQILEREVPLIRQYIAPELRALCVKGRQNYLCLHRWRQLAAGGQLDLFEENVEARIDQWVNKTVHGDRSELGWLSATSPLWQKICCLSHSCLGSNCPESSACFLNRLRRDAAASRLLIVNHHLLFSDLAIRKTGYGEVLPRYDSVIFDEAHHIEQVATTFFGFTFSRYQLIELAGDVERSADNKAGGEQKKQLLQAANRLLAAAERFAAAFPPAKGRFLLQSLPSQSTAITTIRDDLQLALHHLEKILATMPANDGPWSLYLDRTLDLQARLEMILAEQFDDLPVTEIRYTYWYERHERNLSLFATPVDVAPELQTTLFAATSRCLFTSATLTTGCRFNYFLERLGLAGDTPTLALASPFDYQQRTRIFIPAADFPEPAAPGYLQALHSCMETLIDHAQGRTLALFTSFQAMNQAWQNLRDRLPYPVLVQGEAPRRVLLDRFSRTTESILFAVASFWEGVDVPGESLSLVIMDKLPFEVPSDPVIMTRINRIKAMGGNPFADFQVPRAILTLRQGAGRLMRTANDRGVIAIMDTRLFTKGYGRLFLSSLPPAPVTRDLEEIADFFQGNPAADNRQTRAHPEKATANRPLRTEDDPLFEL